MIGRPVFVDLDHHAGRRHRDPGGGQRLHRIWTCARWATRGVCRRSRLLGVEVQQRHLIMFVTTMVLVAVLFAFFRYTRMGLAMRAVAFDQEAALAQGVSVGVVFALSWAIAGALATVAGMFVSTGAGVDQQLWLIALKALPVIILGGLDSLRGAVIGGLSSAWSNSWSPRTERIIAPWLGGDVLPRHTVFGDAGGAAGAAVRAVRHPEVIRV